MLWYVQRFDGQGRLAELEVSQGELDYALMQINNRGPTSTPATTTRLSVQALSDPPSAKLQRPVIPSKEEIGLHVLVHTLIWALSVLSLVELWKRAPIGIFVAFLIWTVVFYVILVLLSWNGRPRYSTLTALLYSIRGTGRLTSRHIGTPSSTRLQRMIYTQRPTRACGPSQRSMNRTKMRRRDSAGSRMKWPAATSRSSLFRSANYGSSTRRDTSFYSARTLIFTHPRTLSSYTTSIINVLSRHAVVVSSYVASDV